MKIFKFLSIVYALAMALGLSSCHDTQSYADLLEEERFACNAFLSNFRIVSDIPADTVFETGSDAPFYRLDPDGNVYMQVLDPGDRAHDKARPSQAIYFRYTRYNLVNWYKNDRYWVGEGNADDMGQAATSFSYGNYTLPSSAQWGFGLQAPLNYLGVNCEVNLVIKSQAGLSAETRYVQPFMYHVRYFHNKI